MTRFMLYVKEGTKPTERAVFDHSVDGEENLPTVYANALALIRAADELQTPYVHYRMVLGVGHEAYKRGSDGSTRTIVLDYEYYHAHKLD